MRQADPGLPGPGENATGHFGLVVERDAIRRVVHIVKLRHRGIAGLQHLDVHLRGCGAQALRIESASIVVHHSSPRPEISSGATRFREAGHQALKRVAVQVGHARNCRAGDAFSGGRRPVDGHEAITPCVSTAIVTLRAHPSGKSADSSRTCEGTVIYKPVYTCQHMLYRSPPHRRRAPMSPWDQLWIDAKLATMRDGDPPFGEIRDAALAAARESIAWVGAMRDLPGAPDDLARQVTSVAGRWITPGLIDCHTHLPTTSLLLMLNMACTLFGLTTEEALAGVTRHAARALGLEGVVGTLEVGRRADLAIWEISEPAELCYWLGTNPCVDVVCAGHGGTR